ncbi:MAG: helix-turn-helix transcriptional regulator [Elusimicrobia bacterium]|nr:helix-turn-helix transcriptional regulator [Elusimicrobiota bacterium]
MEPIYAAVGRGIRDRRLELGMTLEDLAEGSSRHPAFIGMIERGHKKASLATLSAIAAALDVDMAHLFKSGRPTEKGTISRKIDLLLRARTEPERQLLFSTLRHLAAELKDLRTNGS